VVVHGSVYSKNILSAAAGYRLEGSETAIDTLSNLLVYYAMNKTPNLPVQLRM
jgi:hypothetical protein